MGMHYTRRRKAVTRIGLELRHRGWMLHGFREDTSDPMTDYYSPASWDGVATHPELGNTVICVDVGTLAVEHYSGEDGWPTFQATPHRKTWHVERDGQILKTGVGLSRCVSPGWEDEVRAIVDHIERVAHRATPSTPSNSANSIDDRPLRADPSISVTIEHDRDWTWIYFTGKPPCDVREQLKGVGARWSGKREGWYLQRRVPLRKLAWLVGEGEREVPLVLNDEGMDAQPPDPRSPEPVDCVACAVCGEEIPYDQPCQKCQDDECGRVICAQCTALRGVETCGAHRSTTEEAEEEESPLQLARRLWGDHRPTEPGDEQRMVYDYVPDWLVQHMPEVYSGDKEDPVVWLKLFLSESRWTFYATEYSEVAPDETPDLFFGYLASPLGPDCDELCYMTLEQVEELRSPQLGAKVERDLWWSPKPLSEVKAEITGREAPSQPDPDSDHPAGYRPGQGDPYDYVPEWMELPDLREASHFVPEGMEGRGSGWKPTDGVPLAIVRLFSPNSDLTWYVIEYDPDEKRAFGLVVRESNAELTRLDYFSIAKMEEATRKIAERDLWFKPQPVTELAGYRAKWGNGGPYGRLGTGRPRQDSEPEPDEAESLEASTFTEEPDNSLTVEDVQTLLDALDEGPILVSEKELGIPTIHDFRARHLGFGMFEVRTPDYVLQYDAGAAMHRVPSRRAAWTRLRVKEGEYDYPLAEVRSTLEDLLAEAIEASVAPALDESGAGLDESDAGLDESDAGLDESSAGLDKTGAGLDKTGAGLDESSAEVNESSDDKADDEAEVQAGDAIEVDLGRRKGWRQATVTRTRELKRGPYVYYELVDGCTGKEPLIGQGITWRRVSA